MSLRLLVFTMFVCRYLACTDEGFIHKCSCSYNEQVLETYVGHTVSEWNVFISSQDSYVIIV